MSNPRAEGQTLQGFVQTLGSDTWLRIDSQARDARAVMMDTITGTVYTNGTLTGNWTGSVANQVNFSFAQVLDPTKPYEQFSYIGTGCYRSPQWSWVFQTPKWYQTIPLIPLFALLLALWNMQSLRTNVHRLDMLIMVAFGCVSYSGMFTNWSRRRKKCPRFSQIFKQTKWDQRLFMVH